MSRISEMNDVLNHYPEFAASGVAFRRIAEECAKRIPQRGIEDGRTPAEVLELACEQAVAAMTEGRLRGPSVANYIVATFKAIAADGVSNIPPGLTRIGLASEDAEMRRLVERTIATREAEAKRPLPDPSLPAQALRRMPPRPADGEWFKGPTRPVLPPRRRDIEVERCEPLADLVPVETVKEYRDMVREDEADKAKRAG